MKPIAEIRTAAGTRGPSGESGRRGFPRPSIPLPSVYQRPDSAGDVDLFLDGNEGLTPPASLLDLLRENAMDRIRRYPAVAALEADIAGEWGLDPAQVVVTAGADDGLDRACRALLGPGRELILPVPTFEMIERYALMRGGEVVSVSWPGTSYPLAEVLAAVTGRTAAIAVVSPNNPTGAAATSADLEALAEAAPGAGLLVDCAYAEFAEEDLTPAALRLPNAIVFRTFSKAWGLAGLRVGYALGPVEMIAWLRAAGQPYAVSGPSAAIAGEWRRRGRPAMADFVRRVRAEREALTRQLAALGARPVRSQANFVLARHADAAGIRRALAAKGIAVRGWPERPELADALRITCPGSEKDFDRLTAALEFAAGRNNR